jgi:hypothetical protein
VAEKPILFNSAMVRAVLDGTKTVTRRVVNQPKKASPADFNDAMAFMRERGVSSAFLRGPCDGHPWGIACPYGSPKNQLWVRETWQAVDFGPPDWETGYCDDDPEWPDKIPKGRGKWAPVYAADPQWPKAVVDRGFPWRPAIHMPRWASRIQLDVVSVRPERLWDITDAEIEREGAVARVHHGDFGAQPVSAFDGVAYMTHRSLWAAGWDSINAKRGFGWDTNPWVWRVEFRRAS